MNRAERRRTSKATAASEKDQGKPGLQQDEGSPKPQLQWRTLFDANPMAEGMPPHFLLYLLNEKEVFRRHGKLLTAELWLQSQMVALICLQDSEQLRQLALVDHGRNLPEALAAATTGLLEELSSEKLRTEFLKRFSSNMSEGLCQDLQRVSLGRDALSHGFLSLFWQILGHEVILWSPRPSAERDEFIAKVAGPRPENTAFGFRVSADAFEEEIAGICRLMDFIASQVKRWDIPYVVFA